MKRSTAKGCALSMGVLFAGGVVALVLWSFRKPISRHFFDNDVYGSLIGLLVMLAVPFLLYIGYMLVRKMG
jgi:Na+-driven multidrug efflux pump